MTLPSCPESCKARCCVAGHTLTLSDVKRISQATHKSWGEFCVVDVHPEERTLCIRLKAGEYEFANASGFSKSRGTRDACIFLTPDCKCSLHHTGAKPVMCSLFPYYPGVCVGSEVQSVTVQVYAKGECPLLDMKPEPDETDLKLAQRFVEEAEEDRRILGNALGWKNGEKGTANEITKRRDEIINYVISTKLSRLPRF